MSQPARPPRNAVKSRARILQAALEEFSEFGYSGARIDRIAERGRVSKPLLYNYFGDKDTIYATALREAYVQIREDEAKLKLENLDPVEALREFVFFTVRHFQHNPWFISILNTENLLGGNTIRKIDDAKELQSPLLRKLCGVLTKGIKSGVFRREIDPADFYIFIASLCYFPVSNRHTLRVVFSRPMDDEWYDAHAARITDMLVAYLRSADGSG